VEQSMQSVTVSISEKSTIMLGKENQPKTKRLGRIRLDTFVNGMPRLHDVRMLMSEAEKNKGSLCELLIRAQRGIFLLSCQSDSLSPDPCWTLYEGESGTQQIWSYMDQNIEMITDVVVMTLGEQPKTNLDVNALGLAPSQASADSSPAAPTPTQSAPAPTQSASAGSPMHPAAGTPGPAEGSQAKQALSGLASWAANKAAAGGWPQQTGDFTDWPKGEPAATGSGFPQASSSANFEEPPAAAWQPQPAPGGAAWGTDAQESSKGAAAGGRWPDELTQPSAGGTAWGAAATAAPAAGADMYGGVSNAAGSMPAGYPDVNSAAAQPAYDPYGRPQTGGGYADTSGQNAAYGGGMPGGYADTSGQNAAYGSGMPGGYADSSGQNAAYGGGMHGGYADTSGQNPAYGGGMAGSHPDASGQGAYGAGSPTGMTHATNSATASGATMGDPQLFISFLDTNKHLTIGELVFNTNLPPACVDAAMRLQELVCKNAIDERGAREAIKMVAVGKGVLDDAMLNAARAKAADNPDEAARKAAVILQQAGLINEQDIAKAESTAAKVSGNFADALISLGKVDKLLLESAQKCHNYINQGSMRSDQAIIALHYCSRMRAPLEDALSDLSIDVI
jgi:hypothetical protein